MADVCRFYVRGNCKNNDKCMFLHPATRLGAVEVLCRMDIKNKRTIRDLSDDLSALKEEYRREKKKRRKAEELLRKLNADPPRVPNAAEK